MLCRQLPDRILQLLLNSSNQATIRLSDLIETWHVYTGGSLNSKPHKSNISHGKSTGGSQLSRALPVHFLHADLSWRQIPSGNVGARKEPGGILTPGLSPWSKGHVNQPSSPPVALMSKSTSVETWENCQYKRNKPLNSSETLTHELHASDFYFIQKKHIFTNNSDFNFTAKSPQSWQYLLYRLFQD